MKMDFSLDRIVEQNLSDGRSGLPSFCTANGPVLEAALEFAAREKLPILIEATSNQVNQEGGYTGMDPDAFRRFVLDLAANFNCPEETIVLGGDHLGPNPWRSRPAEQAMDQACRLLALYAGAGFTKIHLDASMACAGEDIPSPELVASRAADLCRTARDAAPDPAAIRYVIGTEVPTPGGETDDQELKITLPASIEETVETHRRAFGKRGLEAEFERVIAVVAQPGVDFSTASIHPFGPQVAATLCRSITTQDGLIFEAHSTDYQSDAALRGLVEGHFGILKVGPELTFAFREAVIGLAEIEKRMMPEGRRSMIVETVLQEMDAAPEYWRDYYRGKGEALRTEMIFSLSDRIRYYWQRPRVEAALSRLLENLSASPVPHGLLSQYFPRESLDARSGQMDAAALVRRHVWRVISRYYRACGFSIRRS